MKEALVLLLFEFHQKEKLQVHRGLILKSLFEILKNLDLRLKKFKVFMTDLMSQLDMKEKQEKRL
jgi:hypothetical protein